MTRVYNVKLDGFDTPKEHHEFIELLKNATFNKYELLSKFSMMNGRCSFVHKECGHTFKSTPYNLLIRGNGCPDCQDKIDISHVLKPILNNDELDLALDDDVDLEKHAEFTIKLYEKYNDEYIALECYKTERYRIKFIHTKCNTTLQRSPEEMLNNNIECPKCNPKIKWTINKVKKTIHKITKGEFEVIADEYITTDTPIEIRHNICGEIFMDSPNAFMKTPKCKICEKDMSLHEKRIKDFLTEHNISFQREYHPLDSSTSKNASKFDFAIFKDKKLVCLLEYDGEHHYRPTFGIDSFIRVQQTDRIKNKFCHDNDIELIRIPFWEQDKLNKILKQEMKKLELL